MSGGVLVSPFERRLRYDECALSSSPDLPSLGDLFAKKPKKPPLRSGSQATPIPENAIASFTSAASIWRSQQTGPDALDAAAQKPKPRAGPPIKSPKSPGRAPKNVIELSSDPPSRDLPSFQQASKSNADARWSPSQKSVAQEAPSPLKDKPWKKFRPSQELGYGQTTLPKAKVTKGGVRPQVNRKTTETMSKYFMADEPKSKASNTLEKNEPTLLEPAVRRRTDWTPPPDDTPAHPTSDSSALLESSPSQGHARSHEIAKGIIRSLHDTFARKTDESLAGPSNADQQQQVLKKRKAIEMVASGGAKSAKPPSPVKSKAPKKKPRTLTELAMAPYAPPGEVALGPAAGNPKSASLLNYFATQDTEVSYNSGHPASKPRKGIKSVAKGSKKKSRSLRKDVLLSPDSAMRQSSRQGFVFGTSSQLAKGEPLLLGEPQLPVEGSVHPEEQDPFASPANDDLTTRRLMPKATLWSAGARDDDGDLVNTEVIDLIDSPAYPKDPLADAFASPTRDMGQVAAGRRASCITIDSDVEAPPRTRSSHSPTTEATNPVYAARSGPQSTVNLRTTVTSAATKDSQYPFGSQRLDQIAVEDDFQPPPSNQQAYQPSQDPKTTSDAREVPRPSYDLYTDAQLAREISSYGFKAIKKRTAMVALLNQCWASKNKMTRNSSLQQTAAISSTAPSAPPAPPRGKQAGPKGPKATGPSTGRSRGHTKEGGDPDTMPSLEPQQAVQRRRGRPRKGSGAVSGPESHAASIPPRSVPLQAATTPKSKRRMARVSLETESEDLEDVSSSPEPVFSPAAAVDLSVSEDTELSLTMSPTDQQSALFGYITKAVTGAPRSRDPLNPSWHEKMLMYDPIVLEDLAAWLNAGQLDRMGYDGEVSPFDVKKWCESKSVCCLWRVNLHGKERKRF